MPFNPAIDASASSGRLKLMNPFEVKLLGD